MLFWPVIIIGLALLTLFLLGPPADGLSQTERIQEQMVYLAVLATGLAVAAAGRMLLRGGRSTLVQFAIWVGVISGLGTAFVLRDQAAMIVTEIRGDLMPSAALTSAPGLERLDRHWDGHYRVDALINGAEIPMMVDTGASMVLIPYDEARAIGLDPAQLDFSLPVTTANGPSKVAPVMIMSIRINSIEVSDIPAAVAQEGRLKTGLLGMSFLDRLDEASFQGDRLYLRKKPGGSSGG